MQTVRHCLLEEVVSWSQGNRGNHRTKGAMASHTSLVLACIAAARWGGRCRVADNSLPHSHSAIQVASAAAPHSPVPHYGTHPANRRGNRTENCNTSLPLMFQRLKLSHTGNKNQLQAQEEKNKFWRTARSLCHKEDLK